MRCWREGRCLAAEVVEIEVEAVEEGGGDAGSGGNVYGGAAGAGYWRQEVEGVGGVIKAKRKVKVGLGAWVSRWGVGQGEERRGAAAQEPGEARSWCGWCERVVLGEGVESIV